VKFDDMKMLAQLFNLPVNEFMEYSPHDIFSLIHDGRVYGIPKKSNYELPNGDMVNRHSPKEFRQKRAEKEISQQAIAEHSGIPETTISEWEDGNEDILNKESTKRLWNMLEAISYENT
jgi:DNA-binding XRE family transcriptional regulator